ncbi:MAG: replication initiation factor domain-containing protein [Planctomycetota bacterium]
MAQEGARISRLGVSKRRPRLSWWDDFLGGIEPVKLVKRRKESTLESTADWIARCVGPTLQALGNATKQTASQVFDDLVRPSRPRVGPEIGRMIQEYLAKTP